ncbi:hypothetical protein [Streptomyces rhizosphaericus]|uniref:hypothetical protein n=1 Tax=Streptomyces rhizosphaericus TaxID=114699 RepID=UPI0035D42CC7
MWTVSVRIAPGSPGCWPSTSSPSGGSPRSWGGYDAAILDEEGRGLMLVEAVVDRWGIRERRGPGKTVWARITEAR